jgi:hypothetical protein
MRERERRASCAPNGSIRSRRLPGDSLRAVFELLRPVLLRRLDRIAPTG